MVMEKLERGLLPQEHTIMTITDQDYDKHIVEKMITVILTQQALLSPKSVADATISARLGQPMRMSRSLSASWFLPVEAQEKMAKEQALLRLVIDDLKNSFSDFHEFLTKPLVQHDWDQSYFGSIIHLTTQDTCDMDEIKDNLKIAINDVAEDTGERKKMLMTFYVFLCCDIHTIGNNPPNTGTVNARIQDAELKAAQGLRVGISPKYGRL